MNEPEYMTLSHTASSKDQTPAARLQDISQSQGVIPQHLNFVEWIHI